MNKFTEWRPHLRHGGMNDGNLKLEFSALKQHTLAERANL